ncbi:hypothetical protein [Neorhizobium alkalisoli]|nr:hypothetical protein [Neorhizobium alkalisoli]
MDVPSALKAGWKYNLIVGWSLAGQWHRTASLMPLGSVRVQ